LAQDPARRYAACAEFTAALRAAFANDAAPTLIRRSRPEPPATAATPTARYVAPRRRRLRTLWPVAGLLALATLAAGIASSLLAVGHTNARQARRTSLSAKTTEPPARLAHRAQSPPAVSGDSSAVGRVAGSPAAPTADPHLLNDEGFALIQRGQYQAALPLLEEAVRNLGGQTTDPYDGYANYNLGVDLMKLGRCADALPYLNTAKQIEPDRPEVADALKIAARCASGGS